MASQIRQVVDGIARMLSDSEFFNTSPRIPVVVEDDKDVWSEIEQAFKKPGCMALVRFSEGDIQFPNVPGPSTDPSTFQVVISEFPQVWRSRSRNVPSATLIAEASAKNLHHQKITDIDGNFLPSAASVMNVTAITAQQIEGSYQVIVDVELPVRLAQDPNPTR